MGTWNRLVALLIDDRKGMDRGGDGKSTNRENGRRKWFSASAIAIDGGVAVGL